MIKPFPRCRSLARCLTRRGSRALWLPVIGLLAVLPVMAQEQEAGETSPAEADRAAAETSSDGTGEGPGEARSGQQPDAEQVLQELLQRRQENPLIEPSRPDDEPEADTTRRETQVGTAPEVPRQTLKREGQFIITRRGRLARPDEGGTAPWMFVFSSDGKAMADPPMLLMPCRQLETMERIAEQRGMDVTFIVSGQVYVYHNRNYLLPTLVKLAPNRGNLEP